MSFSIRKNLRINNVLAKPIPPVTLPTDNMILHFSADYGVEHSTGVAANNGETVVRWLDTSGGTRNAVAGTSPTYLTNQVNGKPAVYFNSSVLSGPVLPSATNYTIFWVAASVKPSLANQYIESMWSVGEKQAIGASITCGLSNWAYSNPQRMITVGDNSTAIYKNGTTTLSLTLNEWHVGAAKFMSAPNLNKSTYNIGWWKDGGTNYYGQNKIAEFLIYSSALSNADINTVNSYLGKKYGISTSNIS